MSISPAKKLELAFLLICHDAGVQAHVNHQTFDSWMISWDPAKTDAHKTEQNMKNDTSDQTSVEKHHAPYLQPFETSYRLPAIWYYMVLYGIRLYTHAIQLYMTHDIHLDSYNMWHAVQPRCS